MKQNPFNNLKIYRYFFIAFILVLGILAIYVSCKSKSPTDAHVASNDALAAQGAQNTTQTTTSSSTTTTIKPGQSPTNTTTLITSRTLTTTSTSTSTTSSSTTSTTTTSRKPTTTIPTTIPTTISTTISTTIPTTIPTTTTSAGRCNLEWCQITVKINSGQPTVIQYDDDIMLSAGDVMKISVSVKNTGIAASNVTPINMFISSQSPGSFSGMGGGNIFGSIPPDAVCRTRTDALQIDVSSSASTGNKAVIDIFSMPSNCSTIHFIFCIIVQ